MVFQHIRVEKRCFIQWTYRHFQLFHTKSFRDCVEKKKKKEKRRKNRISIDMNQSDSICLIHPLVVAAVDGEKRGIPNSIEFYVVKIFNSNRLFHSGTMLYVFSSPKIVTSAEKFEWYLSYKTNIDFLLEENYIRKHRISFCYTISNIRLSLLMYPIRSHTLLLPSKKIKSI